MNKYLPTLGLFVILLFASACSNKKMSKLHAIHAQSLSKLTAESMSMENKLEGLAGIFTNLFEESLEFNSARKSYQHIAKFVKQNKSSLNLILKQIETAQNDLGLAGQAQLFLGLATNKDLSKLLTLIPKVEQKIERKLKTLNFFSHFIGLLKPKGILG